MKRDFEKTPEPRPAPRHGDGRLVFVIHQHAAKRLHYDLRLQMEGVLKSWAVPKGPSMNPSVKRLALMVEDHPLDYREFEGVIPENSYGAGSVIIWDKGFYHYPSGRGGKDSETLLLEGLGKGNLKFVLEGEKLRGEFALVKTKKDDNSWLLLKKKDRHSASDSILKENRSVKSHKTLEDVAADNRRKSFRQGRLNQLHPGNILKGDLEFTPAAPMPHHIKPMLASLVSKPFDHPEWIFEMKWDGYRAIAEVRKGKVFLYSRNLKSFNQRYPSLVSSLEKMKTDALLDGEIVVVDKQGHPHFQMLQDFQSARRGHLLYYIFDLLHLEGHDLTALPLLKRKELLKMILPSSPHIRFSDHVREEGVLFFRVVKEKGLEGVMAKDSRSEYRIGARSDQWLKVKALLTQEGVIGGFTEPKGSRKNFGALILGVYDNGDLVYIGHAGGGFSTESLGDVRKEMDPLITGKCPFKTEPKTNAPVTWLRPELVCEVSFQGWTSDGIMRQPVFSRLREDKEAPEVVRERPV